MAKEALEKNTKSITKTALLITAAVVFSKILGFLRETVVASVYGVNSVTDAYTVAMRIVATAGLLVATYLGVTFVPSYVRARENFGEETALRVANDALGISLAVNFFLMLILQITAPLILKITGFDAQQSGLALTAVRIALLQLPLYAFINLFSGYLTARQSFLGPNLLGFPLSIAVITVCFLAGTKSGIVGLSTAYLIGAVAQILVFFLWLPKENYRFKLSTRLNTSEIQTNMRLLVPALIGGIANDLSLWVDTVIATYLGEGSAAAIGFAARLLAAFQGLIIAPVANISYSYMSEYAAKNDIAKILDTLWKTVRAILFVVLPMLAISIPSSLDIVRIVYQRGQFSPDAAVLTSTALAWYLPSIPGGALQGFLLRLFYALQDTKAPMFSGIVSVCVNIVLSIILSRFMGIAGITLATSIASAMSALLLLIALKRKLGMLGFRETAVDILKMILCAAPCFFGVMAIGSLLASQSALVRFAVSTLGGGLVYVVLAFLMKEMVVRDIVDYGRKMLLNRLINKL